MQCEICKELVDNERVSIVKKIGTVHKKCLELHQIRQRMIETLEMSSLSEEELVDLRLHVLSLEVS